MKVITSFLAILALSAVTSFAAEGDAPKKPEGDKGKPKMNPEEMLKRLDTDKDGKVSKAEFMASPNAKKDEAKATERFGKMDKNSDGSLTLEELTPKKKKGA
jgi:Ca2+-binding EF-hand superfamily protein